MTGLTALGPRIQWTARTARAAIALTCLAACGKAPAPPAPATGHAAPVKEFPFNDWDAWNSFEEGSWVRIETPSVGFKSTTTLKTKGPDSIVLHRETVQPSGDVESAEREIHKGEGGLTFTDVCDICGRKLKGSHRWSADTVEVNGRRIESTVLETPAWLCAKDGEHIDLSTAKTWYSKEVPGWVVRKRAGVEAVCTAFEKK